MTIRCPECGYENRDMYRFCGMCGATLRRDAPTEQAVSAPRIMPADEPPRQFISPAVKPAAAPSTPGFITEGTSPRSLDYLLEDEPPKSRVKLVVTLLLLVLAGGLTLWHWQQDGYPWADQKTTSSSAAANSSAPNTTPTQPPAPAPQAASPKPEPPKPTAPAVEPPKSQEVAQSQSAATELKAPTEEPAQTQTKPEEPSTEDNAPPSGAEQPAAVAPPVVAAKPKPQPKPVAPVAPALQGDDRLVAEGEKYLYGNGVAENCDLAQKNLRIAAGHSNTRAFTLMGAMYATGHCVNRDLPTAYRWFAKALHQDPSNSRVQQDLEILWKQMTPEERQLATKTGG